MNYQGSCGYVAIGMLLSYYDTFLNDDIIPEQYDITSNGDNGNVNQRHNSPGVQRDIIVNPNSLTNTSYGASMSANDYYNYMSSISNQSLHAKLLTIGANKGYYNFNPSENELPAEISMLGIKNVLEQYFQDVLMFQDNDYSISLVVSNVRNFVIQNLRNNNPVLLGISGIRGGHAVIAYDYDLENDLIYCHFGWGANKTHRTIESEYFFNYDCAIALTFNMTHSHTNNYSITTVNNSIPSTNYYCYDSNLINIVNHTYNYRYLLYSNTSHKAFCECGESITLLHNMVSGTCSQCGYSHTHEYNWIYKDHISHIGTCNCGSSGVIRPHVVRESDIIDNKANCLECGYLLDLSIDSARIELKNINIKYSINGSYIYESGIVILVNEDINAYFNGTLAFYDEDKIPQNK